MKVGCEGKVEIFKREYTSSRGESLRVRVGKRRGNIHSETYSTVTDLLL